MVQNRTAKSDKRSMGFRSCFQILGRFAPGLAPFFGRLLFLSVSLFALSSALSLDALADVAGFEHLKDIAIDCGKPGPEIAKPHEIKARPVCTYENRLCKVMSHGELQFEAFINVDCEIKSAKDTCPDIGSCAKPNQLSETVSDEVRKMNDPNFSGGPDGAPDPLEKPASKGRSRP